jgi:MarR family transcriptional regulator, organic hydroperoxide resistance regulator
MNTKTLPLIDFSIRSAWHRISRMYNHQASIQGMTMSYGFILMMVEKIGTPSTQLGPKMGMEPTSLSRTLNAMEKEGLIRRSEAHGDRRKVLIFLTDEGVKKRREVRSFLLHFNEKLRTRVSDTALSNFLEVMDALEELIDETVNEKSINI